MILSERGFSGNLLRNLNNFFCMTVSMFRVIIKKSKKSKFIFKNLSTKDTDYNNDNNKSNDNNSADNFLQSAYFVSTNKPLKLE